MPDLGLEVLLKGSNILPFASGTLGSTLYKSDCSCDQYSVRFIVWRADDKKKCSAQGNFQSVSGIYPHYAAVGITFPVLL